jgi:hypothetical protein
MNWEKSRALTSLKRDFLVAFFERERNFYLTGGSALGIFYLDHRRSFDLDMFSTGSVDWRTIRSVFIDCATVIKAEWRAISSSPYFHRFELTRDKETEVIDFVVEKTAQLDVDKMEIGLLRIDTLREIGTNKMCTILGRSEIKDFVDLYFLEQAGFIAVEHIDDARKKDAGFDPATLSYILSEIRFKEIPLYLLNPLTPEALQGFVVKLQKQMALLAYPNGEK